jgi:hypothetical protein
VQTRVLHCAFTFQSFSKDGPKKIKVTTNGAEAEIRTPISHITENRFELVSTPLKTAGDYSAGTDNRGHHEAAREIDVSLRRRKRGAYGAQPADVNQPRREGGIGYAFRASYWQFSARFENTH